MGTLLLETLHQPLTHSQSSWSPPNSPSYLSVHSPGGDGMEDPGDLTQACGDNSNDSRVALLSQQAQCLCYWCIQSHKLLSWPTAHLCHDNSFLTRLSSLPSGCSRAILPLLLCWSPFCLDCPLSFSGYTNPACPSHRLSLMGSWPKQFHKKDPKLSLMLCSCSFVVLIIYLCSHEQSEVQ